MAVSRLERNAPSEAIAQEFAPPRAGIEQLPKTISW